MPCMCHRPQGTRHAEFEAIDGILADHGGDARAAGFDRCGAAGAPEPLGTLCSNLQA